MPQMSPISWWNLFLFFFTMYMIFNMLNYFSYKINYPNKLNNLLNINLKFNKLTDWKW